MHSGCNMHNCSNNKWNEYIHCKQNNADELFIWVSRVSESTDKNLMIEKKRLIEQKWI